MTTGDKQEFLKIIFALEGEPESKNLHPENPKILLHYRKSSIRALEAFEIILSQMKRSNLDLEFSMNRQRATLKTVRNQALRTEWWGLLETKDLNLMYASLPAQDLCFIEIGENFGGAVMRWSDWVKAFYLHAGFVHAWIADVEYDYWENAKSLSQYRAASRYYAHLPLRSNGLSPPLEEMQVDTSKNPGRWRFGDGYIEAVGSTMWMSDAFWAKVGVERKAKVASADWLQVTEPSPGIMCIRAADECFRDRSTADLQDRLRSLLFS